VTSNETDFPADVRTLILSPEDYLAGGIKVLRFHLTNSDAQTALYVKLACETSWLSVTPQEAALAPGEKQAIAVTVQIEGARTQLQAGGAPASPIALQCQRLGGAGTSPLPQMSARVYVRLPVAICPSCEKTLDADLTDGATIPAICPYCFERLRPCPICSTPNTWRAKQCIADESHIVRGLRDWIALGGDPSHFGTREPASIGLPPTHEGGGLSLTRRWSYPSVPPGRREQVLYWSAPVAAYGLVASTAATTEGDAHIFAFQSDTGAPLWDPYPIADPVYPERGGVTINEGKLYAATVEGLLVCMDVLRGTRLWERTLEGKVYGAAVPSTPGSPLLVPLVTPDGGALAQVAAERGDGICITPLDGPVMTAPAFIHGKILVHDDSGTLTCVELETGTVLWRSHGLGKFQAAPVAFDDKVYSATESGKVFAHALQTGKELWQVEVTNTALSGTPACDGSLLYVPAEDGIHLVSAAMGRAVRRYPTRRPVRSSPVVMGGSLIFGVTDGDIYGASSGKTMERIYETGTVGSQIIAAPALADGAIFLTATNGVLYSLALS
jgi:outer membrane protein assembly factor BamB